MLAISYLTQASFILAFDKQCKNKILSATPAELGNKM